MFSTVLPSVRSSLSSCLVCRINVYSKEFAFSDLPCASFVRFVMKKTRRVMEKHGLPRHQTRNAVLDSPVCEMGQCRLPPRSWGRSGGPAPARSPLTLLCFCFGGKNHF